MGRNTLMSQVNARMKDFQDIWLLLRSLEFNGGELARTIRATFDRRKTEIPTTLPDGLTPAFAADPAKQAAMDFVHRERRC